MSAADGVVLQLRPATHQRRVLHFANRLSGGVPTILSVDWLNGFLYLLEDPLKGSKPLKNEKPQPPRNRTHTKAKRTSPEGKEDGTEIELEKGATVSFENMTENDPDLSKLVTGFEASGEDGGGGGANVPSKWHIWRTDLMGEKLELVIGELNYEPKNMQLDPCSG